MDQKQLDKIWLSSDDKIVQKLYNFLLNDYLQDESVKTPMITWIQDLGHNINYDT